MSENTVSYEKRLECLLSVANTIQDPGKRAEYLQSAIGEFARIASLAEEHSAIFDENKILRSENAHLKIENKRLKKANMTDERTGLPNRNYFIDKILPKLQRFYSPEKRAHPANYIIVYFDLDGLSDINNSQGHSAGDKAIVNAAKIIKSSIREEDWVFRIDEDIDENNTDTETSSDDDWVGRSNKDSDEFTAVITINDDEDVQRVMLSLMNRIRLNTQRINLNAQKDEDKISISIGFAVASDFDSLEDALNHADQEMYNNKRNNYFAKGKVYKPVIE